MIQRITARLNIQNTSLTCTTGRRDEYYCSNLECAACFHGRGKANLTTNAMLLEWHFRRKKLHGIAPAELPKPTGRIEVDAADSISNKIVLSGHRFIATDLSYIALHGRWQW